jgi:hypothetical protein
MKERAYEFKGIIKEVTYDIKGTPDVKINGIKYTLSYNDWNFDHQIQKGDSLIKVRNIMVVKLVKQKTGEIVFFK